MIGPTINFGWRSRSDITDAEAAALGRRALDLGCHLHVLPTNPRWLYRVEAFAPNLRVKSEEHVILSDGLRVMGEHSNLAVAMALALDKYETALAEHDEGWSADELLTIASQSGMEVRRV